MAQPKQVYGTGERFTVILPAKLMRKAERIARKKDDRSLSALLRVLLRNYIEESTGQTRLSA